MFKHVHPRSHTIFFAGLLCSCLMVLLFAQTVAAKTGDAPFSGRVTHTSSRQNGIASQAVTTNAGTTVPAQLLSPNGPTMVYCAYKPSAAAPSESHMWIAYRTDDHRVHLAIRSDALTADFPLNILTTNTMSIACAGDALVFSWSAEDGSSRLFFGRFNTTPITNCDATTGICNLDEKGAVKLGTLQATSFNAPGLVGYWPSHHWADAAPWISWRGTNGQLYFARYTWASHSWSQKTSFAITSANGPALRPIIENNALAGYLVGWPGTESPTPKIHLGVFNAQKLSFTYFPVGGQSSPTRISIATLSNGQAGTYASSYLIGWRGSNDGFYIAGVAISVKNNLIQWTASTRMYYQDPTSGTQTNIITKAPPAVETINQYLSGTQANTDLYFAFQDATFTNPGVQPELIAYECSASNSSTPCTNW